MTTPTELQQIRLMTGDTGSDFIYLADSTYLWLLESNTRIIDAAVEALEMIINQIALSPQSIQTEDLKEVAPLVASLERRLNSLKQKKNSNQTGFPMIVKSDRNSWSDIDAIYRNH